MQANIIDEKNILFSYQLSKMFYRPAIFKYIR